MNVLPRHVFAVAVLSIAAPGLALAQAARTPSNPVEAGAPPATPSTLQSASTQESQQILDLLGRRDARSLAALEAMAQQREQQQKWGEAAQLYELIADVWGPSPAVHFRAARALAFAGDHERAARWLDRLREEDPNNKDAMLLEARIYAWGGHYQKAAALVEQAKAAGVDTEEPYLVLGDMLYWQGRYEEARAQYELALQRAPQSTQAMRSAARNLLAMGDQAGAERFAPGLRDAGDLETVRMIQAGPDQVAGAHPWRIDLAYTLFLNLDRSNWHGVSAALSYKFSPAATLGIATDIQIREDLPSTEVDPYLSIFGSFKPADWFRFDVDLGFTIEPLFRPAFRAHVQPFFRAADWLELYIYYAISDYQRADATRTGDLWINQIGPGLLFHAGPVSIDVSYRASLYSESTLDPGHLGALRIDWQVIDVFRLFAGAAYGSAVEVFYQESAVLAGNVDAVIQDSMSVLAGLGWDFHPQHGIDLTWSYWTTDPNRDNQPVVGIFQHSLTAHYAVRF